MPPPKTEVGKTRVTIRYLHLKTYHKTSKQLIPNRRSLSYTNLNKNMKTYIRFTQHNNSTPKHKTNRTTREVSPCNDQNYILGDKGISPLRHAESIFIFQR